MATNQNTLPLRETLENAGFTVNWLGNNQPITVSKGGQSYSFSPSDYSLQGSTAYTNPGAISSLMSAFGQQPVRATLGNNYGVNWESGNVIVTNPKTGQSTSLNPNYNIGGTTYATQDMLKAVQDRLTPTYQATYEQQAAEIPQYIQQQQTLATQTYNQMNNYAQQLGSIGIAMLNAYQTQYAQALGTLQQMIAQAQGQGVPQSVQLAIAQMKKDLDEQIAQNRGQMALQGVSGPAAAAIEEKLRSGALTNEETALAAWFDQQQNQIFQATLQLASMQAQGASEYATLYGQAYSTPIQQLMQNLQNYATQQSDINKQSYSLTSSLQQWYAEQEAAAQQNAAENAIAQATLQMNIQRYGAQAYKNQVDAAVSVVNAVGYVPDQQTADLLGVPVGTPSVQAVQAAQRIQISMGQLGVSQQNASLSASKYDQEQKSSYAANVISQNLLAASQNKTDIGAVLDDAYSNGWWDQMNTSDRNSVLTLYNRLTNPTTTSVIINQGLGLGGI